MAKPRAVLSAVLICAVVTTVFLVQLLKAYRAPSKPISVQSREMSEIHEAVTIPLAGVLSTNDANGQALQEAFQRRNKAIEKLRGNASDLLPQLTEEVYAVGKLETSNPSAAAAKSVQLA